MMVKSIVFVFRYLMPDNWCLMPFSFRTNEQQRFMIH